MSLKYSLVDNPLTPDPTDFMARIQNLEMNEISDIVEEMTQEGAILKSVECNAVIHDFFKRLAKRITKGQGLRSPYLDIAPSIKGVFINEEDRFDPDRHGLVLNLVAGAVLKEALASMQVTKVAATDPREPKAKKFFDQRTKGDTTLTPLGTANLLGENLKIDSEKDDEGVFFINTADNSETKASYMYENLPRKLQFEIPDALITGSYVIEVRNRPRNTKELRSGRFKNPLNVA